ncbi:MAG: prolipoprotein diacylglyceryl transferase [Lachnospiraceae bacterium]|nr:prolipoprotein diacylglyceryl transferase [Lachnospiraceae bacterium]
MEATVSFPNLGIEIEKMNKFITVFGYEIAYYGILIGIGMMLAMVVVLHEAKITGQDTEDYIDTAIVVLISAIVGARLYYVIFSFDNYKDNLMDIFKIREGGLAIYGGIIGGAIAILAMTKIKKLNFFKMGDIAVMGLLVGQTIGRWGNFINREAYGGDTNSLFAMKIDTWYPGVSVQEGVTYIDEANRYIQVHPTFLYESMWNLMLFILIMIFRKKKQYNGQVILWYFAGYGIGRTIIEGMRTDQLILFGTGIPVSQALSALLAVGSIIALIYFGIKYKGRESVWGEDLKKIPKEEKE